MSANRRHSSRGNLKTKRAKVPSSVGGAAGAAGNDYQARVAAWWLGRLLLQSKACGSAFGMSEQAHPVNVSGQTNDSVDDVCVIFSDGNMIFYQCKRSVAISGKPKSEFGKAWSQFTAQYSTDNGSNAVNGHPRCYILCYEDHSGPLSVLKRVLDRRRSESKDVKLAALAKTITEKRVAKRVDTLLSKLGQQTPRKSKGGGKQVLALPKVVYLQQLDLTPASDSWIHLGESLQLALLENATQTAEALRLLHTLGIELTKQRGLSFDLGALRLRLKQAGIALKDSPDFATDFSKLAAESQRTLNAFKTDGRDKLRCHGVEFSINRGVGTEMLTRSSNSSFLVVGEPGAGKTGSLMQFASYLTARRRFWFLAVENYEAASLPRLEQELRLQHRFDELFADVSSGAGGVLVLDGLDAAREATPQHTWRELVKTAQRNGVMVVASIRHFDLMCSPSWKELFHAEPGQKQGVVGLDGVNHVRVGDLSEPELSSALERFPAVADLINRSTTLRRLALNVFNASLLCDIVNKGVPENELATLATQYGLLEKWWEERIGKHTRAGESEEALTALVEKMVDQRGLRVVQRVPPNSPLTIALSVNLLRTSPPRPGFSVEAEILEFAHNLLFDYAATRLFVAAKRDAFGSELGSPLSWGLFLRTSLNLYFTQLWQRYRPEFWERALTFQRSNAMTLHKTTMWLVIARGAQCFDDLGPLLTGIGSVGGDTQTWSEIARGVVGCAETSVWPHLFASGRGVWWLEFGSDCLRTGHIAGVNLGRATAFAGFLKLEALPVEAHRLVNECGRLALEFEWANARELGRSVSLPIHWMCRTIATAPTETEAMVRRIIAPEEMRRSGYLQATEVAEEILPIAKANPTLAVEAVGAIYGHKEEHNDEKVEIGSAVLSLQMSRHDCYSSAHHRLQQRLPQWFCATPGYATLAVCKAVASANSQLRASEDPKSLLEFSFSGKTVKSWRPGWRLDEFDDPYDEDGRLVSTWINCLGELPSRSNAGTSWQEVSDILAEHNQEPELWAAVLKAAPSKPEFFRDRVWSLLVAPVLLASWEFKGRIHACFTALLPHLSDAQIDAWQQAVLALSISDLQREESEQLPDVLETIKSMSLLVIPEDKRTNLTRVFLAECKPENVRPYYPSIVGDLSDDEKVGFYHRDHGVNPADPLHLEFEADFQWLQNTAAKKENIDIAVLERTILIETKMHANATRLSQQLRESVQHAIYHLYSEAAESKLKLSEKRQDFLIGRFVEALSTPEPTPGRKSLESFDEHPSWGTHDPRINGAVGLTEILKRRKPITEEQRKLLERLSDDADPQVIMGLGRHFWPLLETWPEFVWTCLSKWIGRFHEPGMKGALSCILHGRSFWWLWHLDAPRACKFLHDLLNEAQKAGNKHFIEISLAWLTGLAIAKTDAAAEAEIEAVLASPQANATNLRVALMELVHQILPREPGAAKLGRAKCLRLSLTYLRATKQLLLDWHKTERARDRTNNAKKPPEWVTQIMHHLDHFASELRFSAEGHAKKWGETAVAIEVTANTTEWWQYAEPVLVELESWLHPHLAHSLIEACEKLLTFTPERCLHWLNRICKAGAPMGLLYEKLATDDIIKILQTSLAEHRTILRTKETALADTVGTLETLLAVANPKAIELAAVMEEFYR